MSGDAPNESYSALKPSYCLRLHTRLLSDDPRRDGFTVGACYRPLDSWPERDRSGQYVECPPTRVIDDHGKPVALRDSDYGYHFAPVPVWATLAHIQSMRACGLDYDTIADVLNAIDSTDFYPWRVWRGEYVRHAADDLAIAKRQPPRAPL